jgi:hypothetical protein
MKIGLPTLLLILGAVLRFATTAHTLGDVFIWIGAILSVLTIACVIIVAWAATQPTYKARSRPAARRR